MYCCCWGASLPTFEQLPGVLEGGCGGDWEVLRGVGTEMKVNKLIDYEERSIEDMNKSNVRVVVENINKDRVTKKNIEDGWKI